MKPSTTLTWLSFLIVTLALIATCMGLFWQDEIHIFVFRTLHGQMVQIYGQGLYHFGYLLASIVLIKTLTLGTAVSAMIVGQLLAGVSLTIGEIVGFPLLALILTKLCYLSLHTACFLIQQQFKETVSHIP